MFKTTFLSISLSAIFLATPSIAFALDIKAEFTDLFKIAHETKSESKMDDLFNWRGVSKFQKKKLTAYTHGFFGRKIREISFNNVESDQYQKVKLGSKTFTSNLPIIYEMRVVYSDAGGKGDVPINYLVGQNKDNYLFSIMVHEKKT